MRKRHSECAFRSDDRHPWHSHFPVYLAELVRWRERNIAPAAAMLTVQASTVCCSLQWAPSSNAHPCWLASRLPAGFIGLTLDTLCVTSHCNTEAPLPNPVSAAWELGLFFYHAPDSYRRFTVRWDARLPLPVCLAWPGDDAVGPDETALVSPTYKRRVATLEGADDLARHLQDSLEYPGMSVTVDTVGWPVCQIVMVRT